MGLDMFLEREKKLYYHSRNLYPIPGEEPNPHKLPDFVNTEECIIRQEVAYWRKANQIHAWFESLGSDELDNCQRIRVGIEQLEELKTLLDGILQRLEKQVGNLDKFFKDYDGEWRAESELLSYCQENLPTTDGFFFGSTEYDKGYFHDVLFTSKKLKVILSQEDANDYKYFYYAWW